MQKRAWFDPPYFDGDEKKTRQARLANTLILNLGAALLVVIVIIIPLFAIQKTGSWIIALGVVSALIAGRFLIFRGRVGFGSIIIFSVLYLCVPALIFLSDGSSGMAMFYFATIVLLAGYFLGTRVVNVFTIATFLIIVAISAMQEYKFLALPKIFVSNPVFAWFVTGIGLLFITRTRNLFVGDLETILSLTRAEKRARRSAETESLRQQAETGLKNRQLTVLNQLGQALNKLAPVPEALERISQLIGQVYDTSNLYIALYDAATDFISFPVYWIEGRRRLDVESRLMGAGLTEFVIRSRKPVNFPELTQQTLAKEGIILVGIPCKCYLGVPIMIDGRVIGVIALQDYAKPRLYDETHVEFLSTIASQAAIALENSRTYEKLQLQLSERERVQQALAKSEEEARAAADRLLMVNQISLKITSDLDFEQLMQTLYEQCQAIAYSDTFYIALYDSRTFELTYPFFYLAGNRVSQPSSNLKGRPGITGEIIQSRRMISIPDLHFLPIGIKPVTESRTPTLSRSYLGLPLIVGERVIGVLSMQADRPEVYGTEQIKTFELLATQVSIAVKNSQLYERLKITLEEREALIRELYHRTRNNMNLIIALLNMQAENFADERMTAMFAAAENRIRSMAIVHEKLIETGDLSKINLKTYIGDLMMHLMRSYSMHPERVSFVSRMEDVLVSIDTALPCGLILNELISNALKHAFPGDRNGTVSIDLSGEASAGIRLWVGDDGIGLPQGFNVREQGSLGLKTIFLLGEHQLKAKVEFFAKEGVGCELLFREDNHQPAM